MPDRVKVKQDLQSTDKIIQKFTEGKSNKVYVEIIQKMKQEYFNKVQLLERNLGKYIFV